MKTARDFLLAARRCEIRDLEKLAQSCALVLAVGELVHGLQRERGSSQIFLVSGGQRFGPELEACIRDSLASEARLLAWADTQMPYLYEAQRPDGFVTGEDFDAYVTAFESGC